MEKKLKKLQYFHWTWNLIQVATAILLSRQMTTEHKTENAEGTRMVTPCPKI